jgi:hypothetical protein
MTLQISVNDSVHVTSPFNRAFVDKAKQIGGKWNAANKTWDFPAERESLVREICREIYGSDGTDPLVTLRVSDVDAVGKDDGYAKHTGYESVYVAGRCVATVYGRDSGAKLGEGVVVRSGGFNSGGSRVNFCITTRPDTVIDILDVPEPLAAEMAAKYPGSCEIVRSGGNDRAAELRTERERLTARIAEIDAELEGTA